jgi:hypothetical protein
MRGLSVGYAQNAGIVTQVADANANVVEVTSGGQLSTSGTSHIGRANNSNTASNANTLTVSGTGSSWNGGNQNVFVGFTTSTTATSNNNVLTIGAGASLTNVNNLTVGSGTGTETGNELVVNGSLSATTVTVSSGNSLSGSGTINGPVTAAAGAAIAPGASAGILTVNGALDISALAGGAAGTLAFELNTPGTSDRIVADSLEIGTDLLRFTDFTFSDLGGLADGTYVLITTTGGITTSLDPTPANLTGAVGTGTGTLQINGNNLELVVSGIGGGGSGFDTWKTTNSATGQTLADDHDNDGVDNGVEYFLSGTGNSTGFTPLPPVVNTGGVLSVTWTKAASYTGSYTTDFVVETSDTLTGWSAATTNASPNVVDTVHINGNDVTYTFPTGTKKFARLKVTGP